MRCDARVHDATVTPAPVKPLSGTSAGRAPAEMRATSIAADIGGSAATNSTFGGPQAWRQRWRQAQSHPAR